MELRSETFPMLEAELLEALRFSAKTKHLMPGEPLLEMGEQVRFTPMVVNGLIRISRNEEDGRELLLYYILPGEGCAMTFTCCMQTIPSEIRAVAEEESDVLLVPIGMMDEWMQRFPTWKSFVMSTIRSRFNELVKTIDLLAFHQLDERLYRFLKEKSATLKSRVLPLSHQQIADQLATSRVVISRLLKKLENDGKLLLYRHEIKLLKEF